MRERAAFRLRSQAAILQRQSHGIVDPATQALVPQDADLDLNHLEPACVLGGAVDLEPSQNPPGFGGQECLIRGAAGVGR
jgi:hypothetical protein